MISPTVLGSVPELADGPALGAGGLPSPYGFDPRHSHQLTSSLVMHILHY